MPGHQSILPMPTNPLQAHNATLPESQTQLKIPPIPLPQQLGAMYSNALQPSQFVDTRGHDPELLSALFALQQGGSQSQALPQPPTTGHVGVNQNRQGTGCGSGNAVQGITSARSCCGSADAGHPTVGAGFQQMQRSACCCKGSNPSSSLPQSGCCSSTAPRESSGCCSAQPVSLGGCCSGQTADASLPQSGCCSSAKPRESGGCCSAQPVSLGGCCIGQTADGFTIGQTSQGRCCGGSSSTSGCSTGGCGCGTNGSSCACSGSGHDTTIEQSPAQSCSCGCHEGPGLCEDCERDLCSLHLARNYGRTESGTEEHDQVPPTWKSSCCGSSSSFDMAGLQNALSSCGCGCQGSMGSQLCQCGA